MSSYEMLEKGKGLGHELDMRAPGAERRLCRIHVGFGTGPVLWVLPHCGGLALAGHQVANKPLYHSPPQQKEMKSKKPHGSR